MSGEASRTFVLSPKFYRNSALSPFGLSTGDESKRLEAWLKQMKPYLDQGWVTLNAEQEWGELLHLFAAVSSGQLSLSPFLPEKGIGEKDQDEVVRKRKRDAFNVEEEPGVIRMKIGGLGAFEKSGFGDRRERGYPGIEVKARTAIMPLESMLALEAVDQVGSELTFQSSLSPSEHHEESELLLQDNVVICESLDKAIVHYFKPETGFGEALPEESSSSATSDLQSLDLKQVCSAISSAGEEGLRVEDLTELVGSLGNCSR